MAVSLQTFSSSGSLRIEVENASHTGDYAPDLAAAMETLAATTSTALERIPETQRPEEFELACGLKATGSGFTVAALTTEANFQVRLLWRKRSDPLAGQGEGAQMPQF